MWERDHGNSTRGRECRKDRLTHTHTQTQHIPPYRCRHAPVEFQKQRETDRDTERQRERDRERQRQAQRRRETEKCSYSLQEVYTLIAAHIGPHSQRDRQRDRQRETETNQNRDNQAHIASEQVSMESRWGPWPLSEPANKDRQPAHSFRLQKANKSDGPWSRWASDIRQSQSERSWNQGSAEWEGSKWSTPN